MTNSQIQAIDIEIHPQAEQLARQYINDFATTLLLQAKIIAYRSKAETVLSSHINDALETMKEKRKTWSRELLLILGSAFVGAFVQGFISELPSGNVPLIATYVILGFGGMLMVFLGLRN